MQNFFRILNSSNNPNNNNNGNNISSSPPHPSSSSSTHHHHHHHHSHHPTNNNNHNNNNNNDSASSSSSSPLASLSSSPSMTLATDTLSSISSTVASTLSSTTTYTANRVGQFLWGTPISSSSSSNNNNNSNPQQNYSPNNSHNNHNNNSSTVTSTGGSQSKVNGTKHMETPTTSLTKQQITDFFNYVHSNSLNEVGRLIDENREYLHCREDTEWKYTALHWASQKGFADMVALLISKGVNISLEASKYNWKPIHLACRFGHPKVVTHLLDANEDVNVVQDDDDRANAIHWAAQFGHEEVFNLLIERGADYTFKNAKGNSLIHIGACYGFCFVIERCLQLGCDIDMRTSNRWEYTALHWSAQFDKPHVIRYLIEHGARIHLKSRSNNFTPLELAEKYNNVECAQILRDRIQYEKEMEWYRIMAPSRRMYERMREKRYVDIEIVCVEADEDDDDDDDANDDRNKNQDQENSVEKVEKVESLSSCCLPTRETKEKAVENGEDEEAEEDNGEERHEQGMMNFNIGAMIGRTIRSTINGSSNCSSISNTSSSSSSHHDIEDIDDGDDVEDDDDACSGDYDDIDEDIDG